MDRERVAPEEWNRRREENTARLRDAVEGVEELHSNAQDGVTRRQLREKMDETQTLFRELKPTHRDEHQRLWERFQAVLKTVREERAAYKAAQTENARTVERAVERLESSCTLGFGAELIRDFIHEELNFPALKEQVDEVFQTFQECKPLAREDNERLWARFNRFREGLRQAQDKQRWRRDMDLNDNRDLIANAISDLRVNHELTFFDDVFNTNRTLKGFWSAQREVTDLFKEHRLRKDDRERLRKELEELRNKATAVQEELNEAWREKHRENISYKRSIIEKNEGFVRQLQERISEKEDQRDNARTSEFADRMQEKIDGLEDKIQEVEDRNRELYDQIANIERKLDH